MSFARCGNQMTPTPAPSLQGGGETSALPSSPGVGGGGPVATRKLEVVRPFVLAAVAAGFAAPALGADRQLTGAEIAALLPRIVAIGDDDRQTFAANGETLYAKAGKDKLGRWELRGDRYCSLFAPAKDWTCRAVYAEGPENAQPSRLTWVGDDGNPTIKILRKKEALP